MRFWICLLVSCCWACFSLSSPILAYEATDRWNWTATTGSTGPTGTPIILTWSFADDGTQIPDGASLVPSDLIEMLDVEFGIGSGGNDYTLRPWYSIFADSYARLSELAGLDFVYEPNDDGVNFSNSSSARGELGVRGDLRIGGRDYGTGSTTLASNYFPDYGEMMLNTSRGSYFDNTPDDFRGFRNTLMHETLHGIGVSHVSSASPGFLMEPLISTAFDGPQLDDILAMQRLYGDVYEKYGGNDAYATATPLGEVHSSQVAVIGLNGNATSVTSAQTDFVSIDDSSDYDYYSFSLVEPLDVVVDLLPQGASYVSGPESGSTGTIDSRQLSDLSLTLYDSSGQTVLASANNNGLGGSEAIGLSLAPGGYFARVSGQQDDVQLYKLSIIAAGEPDSLIWTGQQNATWELLGAANFDNGAGADLFGNFDSVLFNDSAQRMDVELVGNLNPTSVAVEGSSDYVFGGSGAITSGSVTINSNGIVELSNSGNSYAGPTTVESGVLILSGDTSAMQSAITVADGATLIMDSNIAGNNASEFLIQPGGVLQIGRQSPNSNADVFPNNPQSVVNNGQIRVLDFESLTNISGAGDLIAVAELAILQSNDYDGQTRIESGATVQPADNAAFGTTAGNTIVELGGAIIARNDTFGVGTLTIDEDIVLTGNGDGNGALQITETTTMTLGGSLTFADGGASLSVSQASSLFHTGTFDATAGAATLDIAAANAAAFSGEALVGSAGLIKRSAGPAIFSGAVSLAGPVTVEAGSLIYNGSGVVDAEVHIAQDGVFRHDGLLSFTASAALSGAGQVVGDTVMPGRIEPGDAQIGTLSFSGDLTFADTSRLLLDLGGVDPDEFDRLAATGSLALDGELEVRLADLGSGLYEPAAGDLFTFLEGSQLTGGFDTLTLPELSLGLGWELELFAESAVLAVVLSQSADVNLDGLVDGADFLALQRTHPGQIADWQTYFGGDPGSSAARAVPEPPVGLGVCLLAGLCWLAERRGSLALSGVLGTG